jgi:hypothetical protein
VGVTVVEPGVVVPEVGDGVGTFGLPRGELPPVLDRVDCAACAAESVSPAVVDKTIRAVAEAVKARDMAVLLKRTFGFAHLGSNVCLVDEQTRSAGAGEAL